VISRWLAGSLVLGAFAGIVFDGPAKTTSRVFAQSVTPPVVAIR